MICLINFFNKAQVLSAGILLLVAAWSLAGCTAVERPAQERAEESPAPLAVGLPVADREFPQAARSVPILWSVDVRGGQGELTYWFELERNGEKPGTFLAEPDKAWRWMPEEPGNYRLRVRAADAFGQEVSGPWTPVFEVLPPLQVAKPVPDHPSPQMVASQAILWQSDISGGVEPLAVAWEMAETGSESLIVATQAAGDYLWQPEEAGRYRFRVVATDTLGNRETSPWSDEFRIFPILVLEQPRPGKPSPQAADTGPIAWMVESRGGVPPLTFAFELERDGEQMEQFESGSVPGWAWRPDTAGVYRVRAKATDFRGNQSVSLWSDPYRVAPPLTVSQPQADIASPRMAGAADVTWSVTGGGGVGEKTFAFEIVRNDGQPERVQEGPETSWLWKARQAGVYRVRVLMRDALGNVRSSTWSEPFRIEPVLQIHTLTADRPAPQAAETVPIVWTAAASGGIPPKVYAFELLQEGSTKRFVQQSESSTWSWLPEQEGRYQVRATVTDAQGHRVTTDWTEPYEIAPSLEVGRPERDRDEDEILVGSELHWQVNAAGGVGQKTHAFLIQQPDDEIREVLRGTDSDMLWRPELPGTYRLRVRVVDALGNSKLSEWSEPVHVKGPLAITSFAPAVPAPQPALRKEIIWEVSTVGGVGEIVYTFFFRRDGRQVLLQEGASPQVEWLPGEPGSYQFRVMARDEEGTLAESQWSQDYHIRPALERDDLVALLPLENLSSRQAPLGEIEARYRELLQENGLRLLDAERLEAFMRRHRMRYTGGIGAELSQALRDEEGVAAVLVSSLETYSDRNVPHFAMTSRLVLCEERPVIAWIDGSGMTGEDHPGLLGLGRVKNIDILRDRVLSGLTVSLSHYYNDATVEHGTGGDPIRPQDFYLASSFQPSRPYKVAIVPFLNRYARRNAGFVVPLHLIRTLNQHGILEVVEPGLVREQLLKYRLIMQAGPSLAIADVLSSPSSLAADLIMSGYVFDYQDGGGEPKIDFSTRLFHGPERKIVWWSRSYSRGAEGVYFYDFGRIRSAHVLMERMARPIGDIIFQEE